MEHFNALALVAVLSKVHLHLFICQMVLSKETYSALKVCILSVCKNLLAW